MRACNRENWMQHQLLKKYKHSPAYYPFLRRKKWGREKKMGDANLFPSRRRVADKHRSSVRENKCSLPNITLSVRMSMSSLSGLFYFATPKSITITSNIRVYRLLYARKCWGGEGEQPVSAYWLRLIDGCCFLLVIQTRRNEEWGGGRSGVGD